MARMSSRVMNHLTQRWLRQTRDCITTTHQYHKRHLESSLRVLVCSMPDRRWAGKDRLPMDCLQYVSRPIASFGTTLTLCRLRCHDSTCSAEER